MSDKPVAEDDAFAGQMFKALIKVHMPDFLKITGKSLDDLKLLDVTTCIQRAIQNMAHLKSMELEAPNSTLHQVDKLDDQGRMRERSVFLLDVFQDDRPAAAANVQGPAVSQARNQAKPGKPNLTLIRGGSDS